MLVFGKMGIKQVDFFEKNLEKILSRFDVYRYHIGDIAESLYKVGLDDPKCFELFVKILD